MCLLASWVITTNLFIVNIYRSDSALSPHSGCVENWIVGELGKQKSIPDFCAIFWFQMKTELVVSHGFERYFLWKGRTKNRWRLLYSRAKWYLFFSNPDGLAAAIITDAEYPQRVAFSVIAKLLDEFSEKPDSSKLLINKSNTAQLYPELKDHLLKAQGCFSRLFRSTEQRSFYESTARAGRN